MVLRIGETVRSAEFTGLVDVDREPAWYLFSADLITLDFGAAPRLALPGRGDVPVRLAFCRFALNAVDQRKEVVDIDAIDDGWFGSLRLCRHGKSPLISDGMSYVRIIAAWRAPTGCAGPVAR